MAEKTGIHWTDHTFNPWWGCQKVSAGCVHCYAETLASRYGHDVWGPPAHSPRRLFGAKHWQEPHRWNKAAEKAGERRRVFCASMADVFEDHPMVVGDRRRLFGMIERTPWLDWQLLTKRPENIALMVPAAWLEEPPANVWYGTSCEDQEAAEARLPHLIRVPAVVRFISAEPLIGPLDVMAVMSRLLDPVCGHVCSGDMCGWPHCIGRAIHWVITGGESGSGYRPMEADWARLIRDQCQVAGVAFFHKQGSGFSPGRDRELDGRLWEEFPASITRETGATR